MSAVISDQTITAAIDALSVATTFWLTESRDYLITPDAIKDKLKSIQAATEELNAEFRRRWISNNMRDDKDPETQNTFINCRGLSSLMRLVNEQAEDPGLWFVAETATEAYLQQALRQLHRLIEEEMSK